MAKTVAIGVQDFAKLRERDSFYVDKTYTKILKDRTAMSKCLLLTGARQVGKSTLINHSFPEFNKAIFDDRLTRLQAREEPKLFFMKLIKDPETVSCVLHGKNATGTTTKKIMILRCNYENRQKNI